MASCGAEAKGTGSTMESSGRPGKDRGLDRGREPSRTSEEGRRSRAGGVCPQPVRFGPI